MTKTAIEAATLSFAKDPFLNDVEDCYHFEEDAVIVMEDGTITQIGKPSDILPTLGDTKVTKYDDSIIVPGFIDTHVHYPQTEIIGAYGEQLIDWLNNYAFVAEQNFSDSDHAQEVARVFINEQLRNGVTSSAVYCTVYPRSVDALFAEAQKHGMRLMAGKVCMDRNAPEPLLDTPQRAYDESKELIEKWHGNGRLEYVVTPRFAPTSSPEQFEMLKTLVNEYPDVLIQSHVSENLNEVEWVKELFPGAKDYTDVYDKYDLVRKRAIYGHGVHLTERELGVFHDTGAAVAHCPTSNFFLGSGCLNVTNLKNPARPVKVGIGTDLGAGTSFSILQTLNEAYKAAQMNSLPYTSLHSFYLATLGGAEALGLEDKIGSIQVGKEADLTVINMKSTPIIDYRMRYADSFEEALFVQMILGDDRAIAATYVAGSKVYAAQNH